MSVNAETILITTCTKSKSIGAQAYIPHDQPLFETQKGLAAFWKGTLANVPDEKKVKAKLLYTGRSFKRALMAVGHNIQNLYIISAGLGLVHAEDMVVPYELTTSSAATNRVAKQIAFGGFDPESWWETLNEHNNTKTPIADIVRTYPDRTVVLCLSREYLKMVLTDINSLTDDEMKNLRIIGNSLDESLPIRMFPVFMAYDARMNGSEEAMPGSLLDFGIRAAIHFIMKVLPEATTLEHQKMLVLKALVDVSEDPEDTSSDSRKVTDEELIDLIKEHYVAYGGRKIMLLRIMREKLMVKCSQQRFDKVYAVAKGQINGVPTTGE